MKIEIFDNGLLLEDIKDVPRRTACRGIVKKDGKYLVTRLAKHDIYMFPGGGLEDNETESECVVRELIEETGIICKVLNKTVEITEYFIDSVWTNIYFLCEFVEDTKQVHLTAEEIDLQLEIKWLTQDELLDIYDNNPSLHEHGVNIHNREFLGLMNSL